jgi:hypothetical protein
MTTPNAWLLILTVGAIGVLHTLVPDHWAPIAVLARSQGWSRRRTARAAALAGFGHFGSTLVLGLACWGVGALAAARYGGLVNRVAGLALLGIGIWIGWSSWRELRAGHDHEHRGHSHRHRHDDGTDHVHWHEHGAADWHIDVGAGGTAVLHAHGHAAAGRTALLLILGSSPMIEGLPAFFAASTAGAGVLLAMALVFGAATVTTYVAVSLAALSGIERLSLGPLERYGEVLSGAFVALVGAIVLAVG